MKNLTNNELIAKFMGLTYKTIVTIYNYGSDFKHSYDKETIYSNKPPKLIWLFNKHDNYFDIDNQDDDFKYKIFLNYNNWNNIMPVVKKIRLSNFTNSWDYHNKIYTCLMEINLQGIYNEIIMFLKKYYNKCIKK